MNDRLKITFDQIRAEEELKTHTLKFLAEKCYHAGKPKPLPYRRIMAAAACLVMLLFGTSSYYICFQQAFAISVDVNPSVELGINRLDKVISVEAYNEDGYALLSTLDIRYLDYREALEQILEDGNRKGYMTQYQPVAVTIFGKDEKKSQKILEDLTVYTSSYQNVHCGCASLDVVTAAHASGMSFGKYQAFLQLQALEPQLTPDDVRELTMCQIWDRIDTLEGNSQNHDHDHNRNRGHGNKHH